MNRLLAYLLGQLAYNAATAPRARTTASAPSPPAAAPDGPSTALRGHAWQVEPGFELAQDRDKPTRIACTKCGVSFTAGSIDSRPAAAVARCGH